MLLVFAGGEWRFRRLVDQRLAGPAVMGLSWPRLVFPHDYEARFTPVERQLIREHERTHIVRGDPRDNLVVAAMQVLGWCNPVVHIAAGCARLDQELACDAAVVGRLPGHRRLYAEVLLKAHGGAPASVFACALAGVGRHPLEVRLRSLRHDRLTVRQYVAGAILVAVLAIGVCGSLWAASPNAWDGTRAQAAAPDG
jgi:beta-lactamase regulating signal transducer with metallopeptidase domain